MTTAKARSKTGRFLPAVDEPEPAVFTESMAAISDMLIAVAETVQGYRATLIAQGWSEYVIEQAAGTALFKLQAQVLGR